MKNSLIKVYCWWRVRKLRGEFDEACSHFRLIISIKEEKLPFEITDLMYTDLRFNSRLVNLIQMGVYDLLCGFNAIDR